MLIPGTIITREYGMPCVTGIPDAISLIHTGDEISVDKFLGIVTFKKIFLEKTKLSKIFQKNGILLVKKQRKKDHF